MPYSVRVTYTYNNGGNAATAQSNINSYLASLGLPESCGRSGATIDLQLDGLTEAEADTLRIGLTSRWAVGTRPDGRASVTLRPDAG